MEGIIFIFNFKKIKRCYKNRLDYNQQFPSITGQCFSVYFTKIRQKITILKLFLLIRYYNSATIFYLKGKTSYTGYKITIFNGIYNAKTIKSKLFFLILEIRKHNKKILTYINKIRKTAFSNKINKSVETLRDIAVFLMRDKRRIIDVLRVEK